MFIKNLVFSIGMVLVFFLGSSHADTIQSKDASHPRATFVYGSERLVGDITLFNPLFRPLGQLTQAQFTVENNSDIRYTLEYKIEWKDSYGFLANTTKPSWYRFTLTSHAVMTFNSMGKTPESKNITVTVRLADDVFIEQYKQEGEIDSGNNRDLNNGDSNELLDL